MKQVEEYLDKQIVFYVETISSLSIEIGKARSALAAYKDARDVLVNNAGYKAATEE